MWAEVEAFAYRVYNASVTISANQERFLLTTVIGNHPKLSPTSDGPNLRRTISQMDTGAATREQLEQVVRDVTTDVIHEQVEAGIDLPTDGQIAWEDGQTPFARGLKGFEINGLIRYFDTNTYYRQPIAQGKVEWTGPISVDWYKFASEQSPRPVKAVITGPYSLAVLSQLGCYDDLASLVMDLAHALNKEAHALQEAGAPFIQFNEPCILAAKQDIGLLEQASQVLTQGLTTKTGICTYFKDITGIERQFFGLPFQVFGLDFVMGSKNYDLLQHIPDGRELAAGIMDARNTKMETADQLVDSVRRISQNVPLDNLYVCPSAGLEFLPRVTAKEKLVRLVEGAKQAQEVLS